MTVASKTVEINTIAKDILATATALFVICLDRVLLNNDTSFLFLIAEYAVENNTIIVTVLIPPAVPTGEPPINIKNKQRIAEAFVKFSCGMVAKPAVRVVIDWKKDA